MDRRGFSAAALAITLCLGCTETFAPCGEEGGTDTRSDNGLVWDLPPADDLVDDLVGPDAPGPDAPGEDSLDLDGIQPPVHGLFHRVWITGGASISKNNEVRIIGGIRPGNGVPSGDGEHWLIPVFRVGPSANEP